MSVSIRGRQGIEFDRMRTSLDFVAAALSAVSLGQVAAVYLNGKQRDDHVSMDPRDL